MTIADSSHLTAEEITHFVEHVTTQEERTRIVAHLDACEACRSEVVEARRVMRAPVGRSRWMYAFPAVAAGIILMLLLRPGADSGAGVATLRSGGEGVLEMPVVAPVDDSIVHGDSVMFIWESTGAGSQYALTVTGATGRVVMRHSIVDTAVTVPVQPRLQTGTYLWYVDAVLDSGEAAKTTIHRFVIPQ